MSQIVEAMSDAQLLGVIVGGKTAARMLKDFSSVKSIDRTIRPAAQDENQVAGREGVGAALFVGKTASGKRTVIAR